LVSCDAASSSVFRSGPPASLVGAEAAKPIDESDPGNAKLCHRLDAKSITDDDLRFLRQIGLKWARLEYGEGQVTLDALRAE
jgi:hypothetical protein